jgi:phage recombination protein Bet
MNKITKKKESLSAEQIELVKRTVCVGATDDELKLFLHLCESTGLNPLMKQIYAIKRGPTMTYQTSIDGLRLIADRSGNYAPGKESTFTYDDKKQIASATAYVKKRTNDGIWHEISSCAHMSEYKPSHPSKFWSSMPHVMLAKCAEANALRKAFPAELSGLYTTDEMEQAKVVTEIKPEETVEMTEIILDCISEPEAEEITTLINGNSSLLHAILKGYKVGKLTEIRAKEFPLICDRIKRLNAQKAS